MSELPDTIAYKPCVYLQRNADYSFHELFTLIQLGANQNIQKEKFIKPGTNQVEAIHYNVIVSDQSPDTNWVFQDVTQWETPEDPAIEYAIITITVTEIGGSKSTVILHYADADIKI